MVAIFAALPAQLLGNPQGGVVTAGSASISQSTPARVDINQQSQKAIIDWRSFNIAPGEHTNFNHPSSTAATLNRVNGVGASQINGQLTANGQVFIINQNGIIFGRDARVDVAGLVASTSDIANENFLEGRYVFDIPSSNPDAAIANLGHIQIADNGFAVLAAPVVRNDGVIQARLGRVALAGVDTFTLDFEGDGLLSFGIGDEITTTPKDAEGNPVSELVSNTGDIIADGGLVELSARAAAGSVLERVINMEGAIRTRAVDVQGGNIILSGGDQGVVAASGTLDASGTDDGQVGGTVKVLGEQVELLDGAVVDVSGDAGGGKALIGGNFQGKGPEPNAKRTYVESAVSINADALREGDGGQVIVWSDGTTSVHGILTSRGGVLSGDGGLVETSGRQSLYLTSTPDASAPNGTGGTWLIDPTEIIIVPGAGGAIGANVVGADLISRALNSGTSVTLETSTVGAAGTGDITQNTNAAINKTSGAAATLKLQAENSITLNDRIASSSNPLDVFINADRDGNGAGAIRMNSGSAIVSNSGNVILGGGMDPESSPAVGTFANIDGIIINGGTIDSGDGKISLRGTGYSAGFEGPLDNASGIDIRDAASLTSGSGDISLIGRGGGDGAISRGVQLQDGATVVSTADAAITLNGTPGGTDTNTASCT